MKSINITFADQPLKGRIALPASKSITNRLLIIRANEGSGFPIGNSSDSDDSRMLYRILSSLDTEEVSTALKEINTENAGTVMRFLAPLLAHRPGTYLLTGNDRMKLRPIGPLINALNQLGASIDYLEKQGFPPILIRGGRLTGTHVAVEAGISSQFISALMLLGPSLPGGIRITIVGKPVSLPYIRMTQRLMEQCGAFVQTVGNEMVIAPGGYRAAALDAEGDWSSAAFWYESVALAKESDLFLDGLTKDSLQGDAVLPALFEPLGVKTTFTGSGVHLTKGDHRAASFQFDFSSNPDLAQPVMVTCALLGINAEFTGLKSLIIKETDRLQAVMHELHRAGIQSDLTESENDFRLRLVPSQRSIPSGLEFETYGDHRMAMAFAPVALVTRLVAIRNPEVVSKSYPGFWNDLESTGFKIS